MLRALLAIERNIAANFALRRKIVDRLVKWRTSNQDQSGMNNSENIADQRGGGDRARDDAFHFAPGNAHYAFAGIAALGIFAIAAAWLDLGGAQAKGDAIWLAPAGVFLVLFASGLYWLCGANLHCSLSGKLACTCRSRWPGPWPGARSGA